MNYSKVISVTGLGGLYELVSSKADGAVVRSLEDNSTKFVSSRLHNFSHLESIEVFTVKDNSSLTELFNAMKASPEEIPDASAEGKILKAYFEKVYPDLDFDRVYASDMKKMVKWFGILTKNNIDFSAASEDEEVGEDDKGKPARPKTEHLNLKEGKPTKSAPRKIESRGVK